MNDERRARGAQAEALAEGALTQAGYTIVERNWRCPLGEIDIVAQHRGDWVFVEVRMRRSGVDAALESVSTQKRSRLGLLAQAYLDAHDLQEATARIDVVAIGGNNRTRQEQPTLEIIENAVGW
jgi:putative endonuclease